MLAATMSSRRGIGWWRQMERLRVLQRPERQSFSSSPSPDEQPTTSPFVDETGATINKRRLRRHRLTPFDAAFESSNNSSSFLPLPNPFEIGTGYDFPSLQDRLLKHADNFVDLKSEVSPETMYELDNFIFDEMIKTVKGMIVYSKKGSVDPIPVLTLFFPDSRAPRLLEFVAISMARQVGSDIIILDDYIISELAFALTIKRECYRPLSESEVKNFRRRKDFMFSGEDSKPSGIRHSMVREINSLSDVFSKSRVLPVDLVRNYNSHDALREIGVGQNELVSLQLVLSFIFKSYQKLKFDSASPPIFYFRSMSLNREQCQRVQQFLVNHGPNVIVAFGDAKTVNYCYSIDMEAEHFDEATLVDKRFDGRRFLLLPLVKDSDSLEQVLTLDFQKDTFVDNYSKIVEACRKSQLNVSQLPLKNCESRDFLWNLCENWLELRCLDPLTFKEAYWIAFLVWNHASQLKKGTEISISDLAAAAYVFSKARESERAEIVERRSAIVPPGIPSGTPMMPLPPPTTHQTSMLPTGSRLNQDLLSKYEKRFVSCIVTPEMVKTKFEDIGAHEKVKQTLHELISLPLLRPELFRHGVLKQAVSGILLFGPPGTGKTMLAKAVACQSGSNFLSVSSSSIYDMYVGEGEKNVKALFSIARKMSPCVIFIDEVDALLDSRANNSSRASRIEVLNEFMSEWDGLLSGDSNKGIIVMAATNRPFALDDAVLRRLPRRVLVDLPDAEARKVILQLLLKEDLLDPSFDLDWCAKETELYSGSDLKNLCIAAGFSAIRSLGPSESRVYLKKSHFETALQDVCASISDSMDTIQELRKWDANFGEGRKRLKEKPFGFFLH